MGLCWTAFGATDASCPVRTGVFGYGNPLRGDDAVGWHVAEAIARRWPAVMVRTGQQPVPEWAADLAQLDVAYFVDASVVSQHLRIRRTTATPDSALLDGHQFDPAYLVRLSGSVYEDAPDAYVVHVPAEEFAFGSGLSERAARGAAAAIALLNRRIGRHSKR